MPGNIREFDTPQLGLQPSELGVEATAAAARRGGSLYSQAAEDFNQLGSRIGSTIKDVGDTYLKYEDHKEISAGAANGAQLMADLNKQWEDTAKNTDPNNAEATAAQFRAETLEPALEKFRDGFSTENSQNWAEHFVDQYRNHMFEKTAATVSGLAGEAIKVNIAKTVNGLSSAVAVDPSTHSIDNALSVLDHSIVGSINSSPSQSAETAAAIHGEVAQRAKEQIVKSAVSSMITNNPNVDLDVIQKKYGEYIKGDEMKMFQRAAQVQAKANALVDKQAAIAQRQIADQNVHAASTKTITDNVQVDPQTNQVTINPKFFNDALDVARKNPDAPNAAETVRTLLTWGEAQQNKELRVVTDPATASSIDARMFTDNPTSKMEILKAEAAGKLTRSDAEIRSKIIDQRDKLPSDPQFKLAMDGAKELIEGRSPGEKSLQAGKYAAFMQQFLSEYQSKKADGTLPPNALSLRDPSSMLSKAMEAYKSPLANAISGNGGISAAPAQRNDVMPAIPSANQRPAGSIYQTSRGPMKWTGTGWVTP